MNNMDLNLLRVFDTVIELRSVTRAAERLGLTQPAVSHALGRLRAELGDPLFLRGANGLQPTARAEEIAPGIREGLRQLRGALSPPAFDPMQANRRFTIAAGAYFCTLLVPLLVERLRREAPGVTLHIVQTTEALVSSMDQGTVDIVLAGYLQMPTRFVEEFLFQEDMVWIAAADHPLAGKPFDPAGIAGAPRVMLSTGRLLDVSQAAAVDALYEQHFRTGPPGVALAAGPEDAHTVYDSQTAIEIVARTNMVALAPRRIAARAKQREAIAILSPHENALSFSLSMFWHRKQTADMGLEWLRAKIRQSAEP
jgi:DNA-binding transcriptional LysR family regulator